MNSAFYNTPLPPLLLQFLPFCDVLYAFTMVGVERAADTDVPLGLNTWQPLFLAQLWAFVLTANSRQKLPWLRSRVALVYMLKYICTIHTTTSHLPILQDYVLL